MPRKIATLCHTVNCFNKAYEGNYCEACKQKNKRERYRTEHQTRKEKENYKEKKKFYNSAAWKKLRKHILATHPFCKVCGAIATEVDHIVAIEDGGELYSYENLQPLCKSCHSTKTGKEVYNRRQNEKV
ncbi:HNH endonuclease [Candidatus Parcubacteria bacterium]|nr:MAG: HNH endonuclease [Candidatus Parcubacteria bacterium]